MKKLLFIFFLSACCLGASAQYWNLTGNAGATPPRYFFGTTDNNPIIFKTNNIERMTLLGNKPFLGIGVSDPHAPLHLHYDASNFFGIATLTKMLQLTTPRTGNGSNNGFIVAYGRADEIIFKQQEQNKFFLEGPGGGLMIAPDGKIGVGTEQPQEKLHIADGNILLSNNTNYSGSMVFQLNNNKVDSWGIESVNATGEGHGLNFWNYRNTELPKALVKNSILFFSSTNYYVGIGTKNPQAKLHVNGTFRARKATFLEDVYFNGNVGIGTEIPHQKLHIVGGNVLISKTSARDMSPGGYPNGSIFFGADINSNSANGKWGIEYLNGEDNAYGLNFWKPWNYDDGNHFNYGLFLRDNGNVGIGTKNPQARLDIAGNVCVSDGGFKLSIGSAAGQNLAYGTSYIGFNATRDNGNWTLAGDGANNGGGVIWGGVNGSINFSSIPSTGAGTKTLTDAQVKSNIKMRVTADGILRAKQVQVTLADWPDFAFKEDYKIRTLEELEQYIKQNHRLPEIPSEQEILENGLDLGDMHSKLLLKIEELTLYILQQNKQITDLQEQMNEFKNNKP